ncbi:unnamed protein product [Candida verbasci]|uniref:Glucosidase II subunit alpha n=1 Tax=Candida verbasci TaxID=1227364 RepID=A0A9W4U0T1_9ASCO|nr:unnamed protein product [Candida verbasci]
MNLWLILSLFTSILAVKDYLFKPCEQNGFCNRNKHYSKNVESSPYNINEINFNSEGNFISGIIHKSLPSRTVKLPFEISIIEGNFRFKMNENRQDINSIVNINRYDETPKWAFINTTNDQFIYKNKEIIYRDHKVAVQFNPVKFTFYYKGKPQLIINDKHFLNFEHQLLNDSDLLPFESTYNTNSDDFPDSKNDKLPLGRESIGLDFTLLEFNHLYGIPEHADSFSLKDTSNSEPYRLYNVDIFEYETNSKLPMYGSIPLLVTSKPEVSLGIFWVNSADTYIDINKGKDSSLVHFMSENGILEFIIIIEEKPQLVNYQYGKITGFSTLPNLFSLGYHQCRWNYNDEGDVLDIHSKFDQFEIPYDAIWLDIEYAENKKYFTWNKETFPNPEKMMSVLDRTGRNLIVIIDPHIKTGYQISDELLAKEITIKDSQNSTYFGHCWPGESVWIDTLNPNSQSYWNNNHLQFMKNNKNLHLWNDMNEPSVFNGPETSSPKDNLHFGNYEHRSIHNLYGLTYHESTYKSLINRNSNIRPFILTRSYFSGSQRTSAMWTGDNMSKWEYLKISIPMILTSNIVNFPFSGADVGGFFGNPSKELLTRWYQTGIFYPFFRAHAHIDSRRREPWVVGDPYTGYIRDAIRLRYKLLPVFYTSFYINSINGTPVIKPIYYENLDNGDIYDIDDEFFISDTGILVKPITDEAESKVNWIIPDDSIYYDFTNGVLSGVYKDREYGLGDIPMLLKGGSIIPMKLRYRRSSKLMKYDPYTIVIALDKDGKAYGELYVDDGESFNNDHAFIKFKFENKKFSYCIDGDYLFKLEKLIINGITVTNFKNNTIVDFDIDYHDEL